MNSLGTLQTTFRHTASSIKTLRLYFGGGLYSISLLADPGSADTAERQFWENPDIWQYLNHRVGPLFDFSSAIFTLIKEHKRNIFNS